MQNYSTRVPTMPVTTTPQQLQLDRIQHLVLDQVSDRTKRDYTRALNDFITWHHLTHQHGLTRAAVQAHIAALKAHGVGEASINQRLAAIRKLAQEAADHGLIDETTCQAIKRVGNVKRQGAKLGNWLTKDQATAMLNAPDTTTRKGQRDQAVLALMIGAGLRREELCRLSMHHFAQREGRWVILNLVGKHNRTRTVPVAGWIKAAVDRWLDTAGLDDGYVFRRFRRGDHIQDEGMTPQAVWDIVQEYAPVEKLAPHDLRRTFAKLADKAGADLVQIQKSLGHASVKTTERYVGADLDLRQAPSDLIQLEIAK